MVKRFHCWFEQSGTFKNEFKKLGFEAYDYDILNDFNETDYQVDLFQEIEKAYKNEPSIMDSYGPEDMVLAFFPCVRFETQITLWYKGKAKQQKTGVTKESSSIVSNYTKSCTSYTALLPKWRTSLKREE